MNTTGFIRGYMSKSYKGEDFIIHVATCIEKQLKEWDANYEVSLLKLANYELVVLNKDKVYQVTISEEELNYLQHQSPYSLDHRIWEELRNQGVVLIRGTGNYLEHVFPEFRQNEDGTR
jgi:hypothetical protein